MAKGILHRFKTLGVESTQSITTQASVLFPDFSDRRQAESLSVKALMEKIPRESCHHIL